MDCRRKLFRISYQHLLKEITQSLGWAEPVYSTSGSLGNVASVVIRPNDAGPLAYFFEGESQHVVASSEELAAEKAVLFLMDSKNILVLDYNFRKREENEACLGYYKAKKDSLGVPRRKRKSPACGVYDGVASVDFWAVLEDVLKEYLVPVTAVECVDIHLSRKMCFFGIQHASLKMEWVLGSSSGTESLARQNLAKKALKYLQPRLGFEIEDLSYHKMRMAGLQCSLERESYLAVRERTTGVIEGSGSATLAVVDWCKTPVHEEAMIRVPNSPPPAPKKKRRVGSSDRKGSAGVDAGVCLYNLPDDLSTIFTVTGRM